MRAVSRQFCVQGSDERTKAVISFPPGTAMQMPGFLFFGNYLDHNIKQEYADQSYNK